MRRLEGTGDPQGVALYSRDLGGISMEHLSTELRQTRSLVNAIDARDLRRGFTLTLLLLLAAAWVVSLLPLILIAYRVSRPIERNELLLLQAFANRVGEVIIAGGDRDRRLERAMQRFRASWSGAPPVA